ncbi:MAG: MFS transporter, partial [Acidobacteriota bacterium]
PISVLLLVIVTVCISVLTRLIPEPAGARLEASGPSERRDRGGLLNGIVLLARSPYLAGICVYLFLYTLSSTVLYFEQAHIVKESISDAGDRTSFFAWIDFSVNSLTFVTQLLLTGRILTLFGVGTGLALLPALTLGGFAWLSAAPSLTVLAVFQVLRRSMNYAVARPAREVLYTVVGREEKYKAKSFIDTFVYRAGDQIGAWGFELLTVFGLGLSAIALTAVPMAGLWIVVGLLLGHAHRSRARR